MNDLTFVDTNILVYALDQDAGEKRARAADALRMLWTSGLGRLSVQVLHEFYVNVTRKLSTPVARSSAREVVVAYGAWIGEPTTATTVARAAVIADMAQLSFWDALVVQAAIQAGADRLVSEDLQDGRRFGSLTIENPFRTA
jgi:predicted nucleic acid-binding protein